MAADVKWSGPARLLLRALRPIGLSPCGAEGESGIAQGRAAAADLWGEADDRSIKNSLSKG